MESNELKHAMSQISEVFAHLEKSVYDQIPAEYIKFVEDNKGADKISLDFSKPLENQLSKKAIAFLAIIRYNEFSESKEDKREFLNRINKNK